MTTLARTFRIQLLKVVVFANSFTPIASRTSLFDDTITFSHHALLIVNGLSSSPYRCLSALPAKIDWEYPWSQVLSRDQSSIPTPLCCAPVQERWSATRTDTRDKTELWRPIYAALRSTPSSVVISPLSPASDTSSQDCVPFNCSCTPTIRLLYVILT